MFDTHWCGVCGKYLKVGTVAPWGVYNRHRRTKRHKKFEAEIKAGRRKYIPSPEYRRAKKKEGGEASEAVQERE